MMLLLLLGIVVVGVFFAVIVDRAAEEAALYVGRIRGNNYGYQSPAEVWPDRWYRRLKRKVVRP